MTSPDTTNWARKLFEPTLQHQRLPLEAVMDVIAQGDGVSKEMREVAATWKKTGVRPGSKSADCCNWIEKIYGEYNSLVENHLRDIEGLRRLRSRAEESFTKYLKNIQSSALKRGFNDVADSAMKGLNQLNPDTFCDDLLTLGRGQAMQPLAKLIVEVWKDASFSAEQTTNAARALRRHAFLALYKDDNGNAGIETNAVDEEDLLRMFCEKYEQTEAGSLLPYLHPLIEIACSLRGYKSAVSHVTVLQAGAATFPNSREVKE